MFSGCYQVAIGRCFRSGVIWAALRRRFGLFLLSPSPEWPGYELNNDAKMYMSKRWFHDSGLSGLGFYLFLWDGEIGQGGAMD